MLLAISHAYYWRSLKGLLHDLKRHQQPCIAHSRNANSCYMATQGCLQREADHRAAANRGCRGRQPGSPSQGSSHPHLQGGHQRQALPCRVSKDCGELHDTQPEWLLQRRDLPQSHQGLLHTDRGPSGYVFMPYSNLCRSLIGIWYQNVKAPHGGYLAYPCDSIAVDKQQNCLPSSQIHLLCLLQTYPTALIISRAAILSFLETMLQCEASQPEITGIQLGPGSLQGDT